MPSQQLPLCSSNEVIAALERLTFERRRKSKGSHQAMVRDRGGHKDITIVPLGKREIPRGTLKSILRLGNVTPGEFMKALRT